MTNAILPALLQKGDTIAITASSGKMVKQTIDHALSMFKTWGLKVKVGKTVELEHYFFAGDDSTRLKELQGFLNDSKIKAIFFARGGYGMSRIVDQLDLGTFTKKPKWICGYSDVTVLQQHIWQHSGVATMHGSLCADVDLEWPSNEGFKALKEILFKGKVVYPTFAHELNMDGQASAPLLGGCLSLLYAISGTQSQHIPKGAILFIEDIGEYIYHIDRMMNALKRRGFFEGVSAVIVGGLNHMAESRTSYNQSVEAVIQAYFEDKNIPIAFNFKAGHVPVNYPLMLGQQYKLTVKDKTACLELKPILNT